MREGSADPDPHLPDPIPVLAGWESMTGWYWFATELLEDGMAFGYVQGLYDEAGYFDTTELDSISNVWRINEDDLAISGRRRATEDEQICSLCGRGYHGYGHNAQPLSNGRCCDPCNVDVVASRLEAFRNAYAGGEEE